ncbi:hypothetical protein ERX35_001020 [Macrococcus equipercicus]|uniref:Uncharacterized protein n=1 Tax=Macrococcus equipercicus TaxID=69967 RepID=A0ABQ6RBD1_9STAP|nr:hypothetical protein [Macrococcus equipercicus]KAA1042494.1 hypothetical protein ERX35_001020 [Macrococcus equipercicus]
MELLITIIMFICTFYIYKNLVIICGGVVPALIGDLSRTEDGNAFIYFILSIIIPFVLIVIMFVVSYKILGNFYPVAVIAVALFFKYGTNKGVIE